MNELQKLIQSNLEKWNGEPNMQSVIIPMIRRVVPSIIAADLAGVQTAEDTITFGMETFIVDDIVQEYYTVNVSYWYQLKKNILGADIIQWCYNTYGQETPSRWYCRGSSSFVFKHEADRTWFLMRWSA